MDRISFIYGSIDLVLNDSIISMNVSIAYIVIIIIGTMYMQIAKPADMVLLNFFLNKLYIGKAIYAKVQE